MSKTLRLFIAFSIVPQILFIKILSSYPYWVEENYSNMVYPKISNALRLLYGWVPFSVGDLLYITAIGYVLWWFFTHRKKVLKSPRKTIVDLLSTASILYFVFHVFWGLNYYRLPLHKKQNINPIYTTEQLIQTTKKITAFTNKVHLKLVKDSSAVVTIQNYFDVLKKNSVEGYQNSAKIHPYLEYKNPSQKLSLLSTPLAYIGFSGYLNPFTNEAQINYKAPTNSLPLTLAHEQAHQLGYAAESEANFIAFLTTYKHSDLQIQYAAYSFALRYCLVELSNRNKKVFEEIKDELNPGILTDFENRSTHWARYKNPLEPLFKSIYNNFLKANAQDKGIKSYSHVVGLIVGHYEAQPNH